MCWGPLGPHTTPHTLALDPRCVHKPWQQWAGDGLPRAWGSHPIVACHSAGALLNGWRFGKCVPCATCRFCSWRSCTVSRTMVPPRGPSLEQRTLYSSLHGSDCHWIRHLRRARRNISSLCLSCCLPGAAAATSFASWRTLGPARLRTQASGSCDNQSSLTPPHAKRSG